MTELGDVLVVLGSAYAVFVAIVLYARRRAVPRPGSRGPIPDGGGRGLLRHVLITVAGGYVMFIAIVLVFHVWVVGERDTLRSAAWGGAFLAACAVPSFLLLSWIERRVRR